MTSASPPRNSSVPTSNGPKPTAALVDQAGAAEPDQEQPQQDRHAADDVDVERRRRAGAGTAPASARCGRARSPSRRSRSAGRTRRRSGGRARTRGARAGTPRRTRRRRRTSRCTRCQPSSCGTIQTIRPTTAAVLTPASTMPRMRCRRSYSARRDGRRSGAGPVEIGHVERRYLRAQSSEMTGPSR